MSCCCCHPCSTVSQRRQMALYINSKSYIADIILLLMGNCQHVSCLYCGACRGCFWCKCKLIFSFVPKFLWPPCIADADIIFLLRFYVFPRLIAAIADWMSTIGLLLHMVWSYCEFRMQVWNMLHAARWKSRTQKSPKIRHLDTIAQLNFVGLYLHN